MRKSLLVVLVVMRLFLCLDAPVKTQRFVPQTNTSPHDARNNNNTHARTTFFTYANAVANTALVRDFTDTLITEGNASGGVWRDGA